MGAIRYSVSLDRIFKNLILFVLAGRRFERRQKHDDWLSILTAKQSKKTRGRERERGRVSIVGYRRNEWRKT